ncbi:MAG: WD40 repeat domain-containing protein [Planctomycetes bacterium]|nr:WD40 repeat domain-containing protein [Planctomycetota bacterium]
MNRIFRRWRLLSLLACLAALGWTLYRVLPIEPRWQMAVKCDFNTLEFHWYSDSKRVRVISGFEGLVAPQATMLLDVSDGSLISPCEKLPTFWRNIILSPGASYGLGLLLPRELFLFDFDTRSERILTFENMSVCDYFGFSPSGDLFVVSYGNERRAWVHVLRCDTAATVCKVEGASRPVFHPDGKRLFCAGLSHIGVFDIEKGKEIAKIPANGPWFSLSPNGAKINLMDDSPAEFSIWDISDPFSPKRSIDARLHDGDWQHFSPDGRWWIVNAPPNAIRVYDTQSCKLAHEWVGPYRNERYFTPDSRHVAIASLPSDKRQTLHLANLQSGQYVWSHPIDHNPPPGFAFGGGFGGTPDVLRPPVFTKNSRKVAVIGPKQTVDILAVDTGRVLAQIPAPGSYQVETPVLTPDSRYLLIQTQDRRPPPQWLEKLIHQFLPVKPVSPYRHLVSVVDMETHRELLRLDDAPGQFVSLSPDGLSLLIGKADAEETLSLTCYEIPACQPWLWILGVPLGLLTLMLSARWLLIHRKRGIAQVTAKSALSS